MHQVYHSYFGKVKLGYSIANIGRGVFPDGKIFVRGKITARGTRKGADYIQ